MPEKQIIRCGLYVRVSTSRQASTIDGSLETQLDRLTKTTEIKSNETESWVVAEVYREEGKSGKNTDRPEYQRMLADAKAKKIDVILCTKIDRITRSLPDFYNLHTILEASGVRFISLNESFDTSTPSGRAMLKITLVFAELERETTAERTKDKMHWRAEEGLWNGGQILGYDIDPTNKGTLIANQAEAEVIKLIFTTYRETRSLERTAKKVNSGGYRSKVYVSRRGVSHGGNIFLKSNISRIINNPVYIGKILYHGELFNGKHEAIITPEVWDETQALLKAQSITKSKPRVQNNHAFLLEKLLKCSACGGGMTPYYSSGRVKRYYYYKCVNTNNGSGRCTQKPVSADQLEEFIIDHIVKLIGDKQLFDDVFNEAIKTSDNNILDIKTRQRELRRVLMSLNSKIGNIVEFITLGKGTQSLGAELEALEQQKTDVMVDLGKLDQEATEIKAKSLDADAIKQGLTYFGEAFKYATPDQKKELLAIYIDKIIWNPAEIKMGLNSVRPISLSPQSTAPQLTTGTVDRLIWLPGQDSNLRPGG